MANKRCIRISARTIENRRQALELRLAGANYEEIGTALGLGKTQAWRLVHGALQSAKKKIAEDVEKVRDIEVRRLDALLVSLWPKKADPQTAATILKLMERRSRLLGLDAPDKRELSGPQGTPLVQGALLVLPAKEAMTPGAESMPMPDDPKEPEKAS